MNNNGAKALVLIKLIGTIVGTTVLVGGLIAGGFAAYYGLETRSHAEEEHVTMAASCKEKRIEIRKEAKEERKLLQDWLEKLLNKHHDETREDMNSLKEEIRYMRREFKNGRPR